MQTPPRQREIYSALCQEAYIPLPSRDWWLDAVCGAGNWDVGLAFDEKQNLLGALPYGIRRVAGFHFIKMPPLTARLNLWIRQPDTDRPHRLYAHQQRVVNSLIQSLPRHIWFDILFEPEWDYWLPFAWKGFGQTTRYTYRLEDLHDPSRLFREMDPTARNHIRRSREQQVEILDGSAESLYALVEKTFSRQRLRTPFSALQLQNLAEALVSRNLGRIYVALDPEGRAHAAALVGWDERCTRLLASGSDPKLRQSGAMYGLIWQIIKDAAKRGGVFDFEGSMLPQIEAVYRSFGAVARPYNRIFHTPIPCMK